MGELDIVQQTSVLFLVIDCASILQCSPNTIGKSPRGEQLVKNQSSVTDSLKR